MHFAGLLLTLQAIAVAVCLPLNDRATRWFATRLFPRRPIIVAPGITLPEGLQNTFERKFGPLTISYYVRDCVTVEFCGYSRVIPEDDKNRSRLSAYVRY